MRVPLWGHDAEAEALAAAIISADGVYIAEIISEPGAPGSRFIEAVSERLAEEGIGVRDVSANPSPSIRSGALASDIEQGWPDDGPVVMVIQDAHLVDSLSLGRLVHRSVTGHKPPLLIERMALSGSEHNPFSNVRAIAERLGTYQQITLEAPTIDDISVALDIERSAAAALHKASAGDDRALVSALAELDVSDDSAPLLDIEQFLSRLARDSAPLGELDDLDRHLVELVTVSLSPVASRVLAAAAGAPEREVLGAVERLAGDGFLIDTATGVALAANPLSETVVRSLSASRRVAANRSLAVALKESGDTSLDVAAHFERAGEWAPAFEGYLTAADRAAALSDTAFATAATNGALRCLEEGAATDPMTRGRLLLARGRDLRFSAYSDRALADFRAASPLLDGAERVDALAFLASVLDDQQLPQDADVSVAIGEWEAAQLGANDKLGSLLSLRARIATRLGFATEADHALERSGELIAAHGTSRQQQNVRNNRAWMAFDRGEVAKAEQLFAELVETDGDVTTTTEAQAWHARALAGRGWADEAAEAIATVRASGDDSSTNGAQFLAAIGAHELAMRTGRFEDALAATDVEFAYVTLFLPAWENGTLYRQADALRALGRLEEASDAVASSLAATPEGSNGRRWGMRARVLQMRIASEAGQPWQQDAAENLTDELLHASWYGAAVELMVLRARDAKNEDLAAEAAALSMGLGDPAMAAAAVDAAGDWSKQAAVARAIQSLEDRVPDDWREEWRTLPGITEALGQPLTEEDIEPDWHEEFRTWLDDAGLGDERISPAQRRDRKLVRRSPAPRRWGVAAIAASISATMVLATVVGLYFAGPLRPDPTTTTPTSAVSQSATTVEVSTATTIPSLEDTLVAMPELGLFGSVEYLGGPDHNFIIDTPGPTTFTGYYWEYPDVQVVVSQPVVQGTVLYVADRVGTIHLISLRSGNAIRTYTMNDDIEAPLAVGTFALSEGGGETTLGYAVDVSGTVKAFDTNRLITPDGYNLHARTTAGPIIVLDESGTVPAAIVFASHDGRVRALDVDLDDQLAIYPAEDQEPLGRIEYTPALYDGRLYIADSRGTLTVLDATTLEFLCEEDTGEAASASPVVADGRVWVPASSAIRIFQTDCGVLPAGEPVQIQANLSTTPILDLPIVYFAEGIVMQADDIASEADIEAQERTQLWTELADTGIKSSPVIANGVIYYGDNRDLIARRVADGVELARYEIGSAITVSPIIIENAIIVTVNGRIIAIAGTS